MYEDDENRSRMGHMGDLADRVAIYQGAIWIVFDERFDGRTITRFDRTDFDRLRAFVESLPQLLALGQNHSEHGRVGPCRTCISTHVNVSFYYAAEGSGMLHEAYVKPDWLKRMGPVLKKAIACLRENPGDEKILALESDGTTMTTREPHEIIDWLKSKRR